MNKTTTYLTPLLVKEATQKVMDLAHQAIRNYLDKNTIIQASAMSFEEFLAVFCASKNEYLLAIRSSIRHPKMFLKREVCDIVTNNYNARLMELNGANMDIQLVLDPYGLAAYMCDYVSKPEKSMSDHLRLTLYNCLKNNDQAKTILKSITSAFYSRSEVCAQECVYNILQLPIVTSSRECVFVSAGPVESRQRFLKPAKELRLLPENSTDIYVHGIIEHYANRPLHLESISLANFATWYNISKKEPVSTVQCPAYPLANADGWAKKRTKQTVLRFPNHVKKRNDKKYRYAALMLYFPWRDEVAELKSVDTEQKFNENRDVIIQNQQQFSKLDADFLDNHFEELSKFRASDSLKKKKRFSRTNLIGGENPFTAKPIPQPTTMDEDIQSEIELVNTSDTTTSVAPQDDATNDGLLANNTFSKIRVVRSVEKTVAKQDVIVVQKRTMVDLIDNTDYYAILSKLNQQQRQVVNHVNYHIRHNT